jgi:hypothetical protein
MNVNQLNFPAKVQGIRWMNHMIELATDTIKVYPSINAAKRANRATRWPVMRDKKERDAMCSGHTLNSVDVKS